MSRLKKVYTDKSHDRDKKRHRIRTIVFYSFVVFLFAGIGVGGAFQHNDTVVGICLIAMGITGGAYSVFAFRVRHLGWKDMTVLDSDELYRDKYRFSKKAILKEEKRADTEVVDIMVAIAVIVFLILGIIKLV